METLNTKAAERKRPERAILCGSAVANAPSKRST